MLQFNKTSACRLNRLVLQFEPTIMHTNGGYPHTKCIQFVYTAYTIEYSGWNRVPDNTRRQNNVGLTMGPCRRQRYINKPTVGQIRKYYILECENTFYVIYEH